MYALLERLIPRWFRQAIPPAVRQAVRSRLNSRSILLGAVERTTSDLRDVQKQLAQFERETRQALTTTTAELLTVKQIAGALLDHIPELRQQLLVARTTEQFRKAFEEPEPLVSVRIGTYNRSHLLFERSLPSVFNQTYTNFEIVVVGDGSTDDTAERFAKLDDTRVRFVNLPHQGVYPEDPTFRWMVAGTPPMNAATQMARGLWIAPLDDDDEFTPNHIEHLLATARSGDYEMVYGVQRKVPLPPAEPELIGKYPPGFGHFGFQAAIYASALRMFEYDLRAWMLREVSDWTVCRRMLEAGVRIGWTPEIVTTIYPRGPRT